MLKFASDLPDDNEYAIVCWGQSNFTPNGTYVAGIAEDPHLVVGSTGYNVQISGPVTGSGSETIDVLGALAGDFTGGEIRVGTPTQLRAGYATIQANTTLTMDVTWQSSPNPLSGQTFVTSITNSGTTATVVHTAHGMLVGTSILVAGATGSYTSNNGTFRIVVVTDANTYTYESAGLTVGVVAGTPTSAGISGGYIYFRDGRNSRYKNVRVLQAYLPNAVEANPTAASPIADPSSTYSALPLTIDSYDKLAVFEDFTFNEGISGFGSYADASSPTSTEITIDAGFGDDTMVGGYVRAESYDGSVVLTTVSTGTIASHIDNPDSTTDQTDITVGNDEWDVTAHGMLTGQKVILRLVSGALPTTSPQIAVETAYYVIWIDDDNYQLATTRANAIATTNITISATNTGAINWHTASSSTDESMVDTASNEFDLDALTHGLVTGQTIKPELLSGDWPVTTPQISEVTPLFAIVVDTNEFKIAASYSDAIAGTAITLDTAGTQDIAWHTHTVLTLDSSGWAGGTPSGTTYKVETWVPHWFDHPYALTAGPGFLHPTNESQPVAAIYNFPRGNLTLGWGSPLWGSLLSYASRVADAIGKRVNVISLAVDSTGIITAATVQSGASHGWLVNGMHVDWNPNNSSGLADRLKTLATVSAPAALTAEGSSKTLKVLAIAGMQGETEATTEAGRSQYQNLLPTFYNWLKGEIFDAGLSYYAAVGRMPVIHAGIHEEVWEEAGALTDDTDGIVNSAITNYTAKTEFAATIDVNDSPISGIHFDGEGESINGKLLAEATIEKIDAVLSSEEDLDDPEAIKICNLALSHVGDAAKITSLNTATDTSTQAFYCNKFYSEDRETLLQQMAWSFATRREPLLVVDDARTDEWAFAYGLPDNAVRVFAVLPPEVGDDTVTGVGGTATVYTASGELREETTTGYAPIDFTVEQDDDGHQILYTRSESAIARFNALVSDASLYPPLFRSALSLKLAASLSGPLIKGMEGIKVRAALEQQLEVELGKAKVHDAVQHDVKPEHTPRQIRARRS